jgi:putative two-component system response regulator
MAEPQGKFNVLAVDDSADIVDLIELTLRADCNVKRALDGRSALQLALEKPRPDLILLDVEMPGSNGYEVCKALKASPGLADVPVIFLTQRDEAQDVIKGFQLGAIDYFTKPINPPVLAARIRAHIELINRRNRQEEMIVERSAQLEHTRLQLIRRLGRAMEYHETSAVGNRVVRLGHYARHLSLAAGARPALCDLMMKAAPLHDIGKLGVPVQVLRKT